MKAEMAGQTALRLRQGAEKAAKIGRSVPGRFLTAAERALAVHQARESGVLAAFDGGWDEAERMQVCFYPEDAEAEFSAVWLRVDWAVRFSRLDHRDLLGSLMALGLDRSLFGDLLMQEGCAYLYALPEAARQLPQSWTEAGYTPIHVCEVAEAPMIAPPQGKMMRDTVASLRMDCVLASGMAISRAKAAEMIRQGVVQRNHMEEERTDVQLAEGDLLSVRGFGRIRLTEVGGKTRKDRVAVALEVFKRERST